MSGLQNIFYFPPHQDDEICNFGVSIITDIDAGYNVYCVLCTDGCASGARAVIGDGKDCHLHSGRHPEGFSREDFRKARDREFISCCRALGLPEENIIISPHRAPDGGLTADTAEKIMLDAIRGFPPETVCIKALNPAPEYGQNPDHTATGIAAKKLYSEAKVGGIELFFESIHLEKRGADAPEIKKITPDESRRERFLLASSQYGRWEPENGFFAVGYHSVRDEFTMLDADPVSLVVV